VNDYDADAVKAMEDLPENTLVVIDATGEVFRRTAYGAESRHQWAKLTGKEEDSYYMFSDEILAIAHTVVWKPKSAEDILADELSELLGEDIGLLAKELSNKTWVAPGGPLGPVTEPDELPEGLVEAMRELVKLADADSGKEPGAKFGEADYPRILDAIKLKHTVTLDCNGGLDPDDEGSWLILGSLEHQPGNEALIGGTMRVSALGVTNEDDEKSLKKRLRTFVQPDGEIGLELTYFPIRPHDDTDVDKLFAQTNIGSLLTKAEMVAAMANDEEWIEMCFGYTDIYDLYFEVLKPKAKSPLEDDGGGSEKLIDTPLWITYNGKRYNVNVWLHED
jgi:hypothetical protein